MLIHTFGWAYCGQDRLGRVESDHKDGRDIFVLVILHETIISNQ